MTNGLFQVIVSGWVISDSRSVSVTWPHHRQAPPRALTALFTFGFSQICLRCRGDAFIFRQKQRLIGLLPPGGSIHRMDLFSPWVYIATLTVCPRLNLRCRDTGLLPSVASLVHIHRLSTDGFVIPWKFDNEINLASSFFFFFFLSFCGITSLCYILKAFPPPSPFLLTYVNAWTYTLSCREPSHRCNTNTPAMREITCYWLELLVT